MQYTSLCAHNLCHSMGSPHAFAFPHSITSPVCFWGGVPGWWSENFPDLERKQALSHELWDKSLGSWAMNEQACNKHPASIIKLSRTIQLWAIECMYSHNRCATYHLLPAPTTCRLQRESVRARAPPLVACGRLQKLQARDYWRNLSASCSLRALSWIAETSVGLHFTLHGVDNECTGWWDTQLGTVSWIFQLFLGIEQASWVVYGRLQGHQRTDNQDHVEKCATWGIGGNRGSGR